MTRPNHNHQHSHGCSHSHHHDHHIGADTHEHDHAPVVTQDNEGRVFQVMLLTGIFMFIEAAGGFISGSLALLADAGHMLTDTAALALAWAAFRVARKSADHKKSYGYHRFQILAAFANGLTLLAIAVWIVAEAVTRLLHPVEVAAPSMLVVAILGLGVNIAAFWLLSKADGENLNVRGALLHVIGDLLGSVAAIAAALIIMVTGWLPIDPLLSALVAGLILRSAWRIVKDSSHILLQGVPHGAEVSEIEQAVLGIAGVARVHDVHAWVLTSERPVVTLHAVLQDDADQSLVLKTIQNILQSRFGISHSTIQIEHAKIACSPEQHQDCFKSA